MVSHCFHDPDVLELVRKQWRAVGPVRAVSDRYGNRIHLLELPARLATYLVSPYQSGIALAPGLESEVRADNLLEDLVNRLVESIRPHRNLRLEIRVPAYFFETRPHALLEPFLLAGFAVRLDLWQRLVDLRVAPEAILTQAVPMVRRKLRRGLREDLKWRVHYGEPVAVSVMQDLFEAARRTREVGGGRLKHAAAYYLEDRRRLIEQGKAALGIVEHKGSTHYLLALVSRELGFYLDGAWAGARSTFANHLLHYRMMLFLKEIGCLRYSAGTVFPDLLSGLERVRGMARFKHGLGADLSPIYVLTLSRHTAIGAILAALRRGPLGQVAARLRRLFP